MADTRTCEVGRLPPPSLESGNLYGIPFYAGFTIVVNNVSLLVYRTVSAGKSFMKVKTVIPGTDAV